MTEELVWKRICLAMTEGNTSLIKYLERYINEKDKTWVSRWIATHHNPSKWTYKPHYRDFDIAREILLHGVNRLVRRDINKAISRWDFIRTSYTYQDKQIVEVEQNLLIKCGKTKTQNYQEDARTNSKFKS